MASAAVFHGASFQQSLHVVLKIFLWVAAASVAYTVLQTLYNLFFHPLRAVPGPFLAPTSRLWARIGNNNGCKSHRIHAAHQRYGKVVRVGPNELSFADPSAVREIYSNDAFMKEETFYRAKRVFHEEMMMSFRDPEAHKSRRKLLSRGFSQASMLDFEPHMSDKIRMLFDRWARLSANGESVDVYPWCLWLSFDIIYHLMFDEDPGSVRDRRPHEVMKYLRAWRPLFTYKEFFPWLEQYGVYLPGNVGDNFRQVQTWKNYAVSIILSVRARGTKTPFLRYALSEDDTFLNRPLSDSELAEECMGGMFGGTGTTANTFVYLLWAVLRRLEIQDRLRAELRDAFEDNDEPDFTTCSKLPYLQACINETLRLYPTIIATLPRAAVRDTVVSGVKIPRGTIVGTQNFTLHRDLRAFPDPEKFIPERWLEASTYEKTVEQVTAMKEAFLPFSIGSRKCVGINVSMVELSKLAAGFFLRFEGEIDAGMTEQDMRMYDVFSASPAGGKLVVKLREDKRKPRGKAM